MSSGGGAVNTTSVLPASGLQSADLCVAFAGGTGLAKPDPTRRERDARCTNSPERSLRPASLRTAPLRA